MGKDYGRDRLEAACRRAIDLKAPNYKFIASTLKNGLDREPEPATGPGRPAAHACQRARAVRTTTETERESYMLHHPTVDKLHALRLTGMAAALAEQQAQDGIDRLGFEERLGLLVEREASERESRQTAARLRRAQTEVLRRLARGHRLSHRARAGSRAHRPAADR